MYRVTVPAVFFDDHRKRGCVQNLDTLDEERSRKGVTVTLDTHDLIDLFSDAQHYKLSGVSVYGREMLGVVASARATVGALVRQVPGLEQMYADYQETVRASIRKQIQKFY